VRNFYNVANRNDDPFIDRLAKDGISYVPFFPLGGFTPYSHRCSIGPQSTCKLLQYRLRLLGFFQRSPNILLIPGTSSINHLRQNLDAAGLELPSDVIAELNTIANNAVAG
jgi:aryl-alcohol dehydrogenase-like predicted oxidoreductase